MYKRTDWVYYDGSTGREGPNYEPGSVYRPATDITAGTGYGIGTEIGERTCQIDGTTIEVVMREWDKTDASTWDLIKDNIVIPMNKKLHPSGAITDIGVTIDPNDRGALPQYNGGVAAKSTDINTVSTISYCSGGSGVYQDLNAGEAQGGIDILFTDLSSQAKKLQTFFDSAEDTYTDLSGTFTTLKNAESAIRIGGNGVKINDYINNTLSTQKNIILNKIFEGKSAEQSAFNTYRTAYEAGHELLTGDWRTRLDDTDRDAAITQFIVHLDGVNDPNSGGGSDYDSGRVTLPGVGNNINSRLTAIRAQMNAQILSALELTGVTNAAEMADALIIQLCQDFVELETFKDDITAAGLTNALNYNAQSTVAPIAAVSPQSNVKLASVNAEFPRNGVKTAYGNFTPYKKEDSGVLA